MSLSRAFGARLFRRRHVSDVTAISVVLVAAFHAGQAHAAPATAPPTLASALTMLKAPKDGIILTVGAELCPLPPEEALPNSDTPVSAVVNTFHKTLRTFGTVMAIAPPTMTVLNTHPVNANIYDGMPPQDAMKFLAASLTQGQWQQLKGDQGLGLSDMVSETQSGLFRAILPQKLLVAPQTPMGIGAGSTALLGARDLTASLPQVRLRLRRRLGLMVQETGSFSFMFVQASRDAGQKTRYKLVSDEYFIPKASLYGVPVRAEVENIPKLSDLDPDSAALHVAVPLVGTKTVGELLARVGKSSGLELYADRRWEGRTLTVLGTLPFAPAADLLRSLAFCLTGAYRQVGPAFVLTDDVLGAGSRRAVLSEFVATASALRQKALYTAGDSLAGAESLTDLPLAADSMTYSATQKKEAQKWYAQSGFSNVTQTQDQLTPEQKASVEATPALTGSDGATHTPDPAGKMIVSEDPALELIVPTLDGPVDPSLYLNLDFLFQPSPTTPDAPSVTAPSSIFPSDAPAVPLAALTKPIPRRAVIASPHTAAEVQTLVAAMKKLGLNQLWLPVMPMGEATDSGSPPSSSPSSFPLLSQAVQATKGTDIAVYAVVDLLTRLRGAPVDAADLTLLGRTSVQAQTALVEREAIAGPMPYKSAISIPKVEGVAVSPFSAAIGKSLLALTHTLLTTPGVAGIVWRATATPGYDDSLRAAPDHDTLALGYTPAARLAFLRKEHVDPVDLSPLGVRGLADASLPSFDDVALENTMGMKWDRFRSDADLSLIRSLFQQISAGKAMSPSKPLLLIQQRGARPPTVTWYGSWAGPDKPLPTFLSSSGVPVAEKVQARSQSSLTIVNLPVPAPLDESEILRQWSGPLQSIGKNHSWDGFVLECSPRKG